MSDVQPMDRRNWERRVETLEQQYGQLQQGFQRVESEIGHLAKEQEYVRELMKSNFGALNRGQEILALKFDQFAEAFTRVTGDPKESPAGRMLAREDELLRQAIETDRIRALTLESKCQSVVGDIANAKNRLDQFDEDFAEQKTEVKDLTARKNQVLGALWLASGGLGVSLYALLRTYKP